MKSPTIRCKACNGTGNAPLGDELKTTLALFGRHSFFTAKQVHDDTIEKLSLPAINNRLETLRRAGLLGREKQGRAWRYYLPRKLKKIMA